MRNGAGMDRKDAIHGHPSSVKGAGRPCDAEVSKIISRKAHPNYSRVAATERSHGRRPWSRGGTGRAPLGAKEFFRRCAAHLDANSNHGLRPWLRSVAATRLTKFEFEET